ncbi:PASTA domain-containing protein [Pseudarthrobacter siccitolerans]
MSDALAWIGLALAIIGLVAAYLFYRWSLRPKRLEYAVDVDQGLVTSDHRWQELQVQYGTRSLKAPRLVVVTVANTGRVEVREDDFDRPLRIKLHKDDELIAETLVLHAKGERTVVSQVDALEKDLHSVSAPGLLFNPGDSLEFRLLVEGNSGKAVVDGRVAGTTLAAAGPRRRRIRDRIRLSAREGAGLRWATMAVSVLVVLMTIFVSASAFSVNNIFGEPETVPNIIGQPVDAATRQITEANLRLGNVVLVESDAPSGTVIAVSPGVDEEVTSLRDIDLVVSQ